MIIFIILSYITGIRMYVDVRCSSLGLKLKVSFCKLFDLSLQQLQQLPTHSGPVSSAVLFNFRSFSSMQIEQNCKSMWRSGCMAIAWKWTFKGVTKGDRMLMYFDVLWSKVF